MAEGSQKRANRNMGTIGEGKGGSRPKAVADDRAVFRSTGRRGTRRSRDVAPKVNRNI